MSMNLTKGAQNYVKDNGISIDWDELEKFISDLLSKPGDAAFWDDELFVTHGLVFHTPDWELTDDYVLDQANYRAALEILKPYGAEAATVGHWTYSAYQCIKVPILSKSGGVTRAALELWELIQGMDDYPVIDEGIWSELELEVWERQYTDERDYILRDVDFEPTDAQLGEIDELYRESDWNQNYGPGEGVDSDELREIIVSVQNGTVNDDRQIHQRDELPIFGSDPNGTSECNCSNPYCQV